MNEQDKRADGADRLTARVRGAGMDEIKLAALDEARAFYGPDAPLAIEGVFDITSSSRGGYFAFVVVRCLQLPEGW